MATLVNGALPSTTVTKAATARFPWILSTGQPLGVELQPGDEFVLDEGKQFFQLRMLSKGERVRTWTPLLYSMVDGRLKEWEVEFRTSTDLNQGPAIQIGSDWSAVDDRGHTVDTEKIFECFCDVIASPHYNPFGVRPVSGVNQAYRFDFENRAVSWHDGTPLPPGAGFPRKMEIYLHGGLSGSHKGQEPPKELESGVYNVKPAEVDPDNGEVKSVILDGFPDDKMIIDYNEFHAAMNDKRYEITDLEEAEQMDFSRYQV